MTVTMLPSFVAASSSLSLLAASSSSTTSSPLLREAAKVTGLYRYAVKGLSGDVLDTVVIQSAGETFPDDRRYALLQKERADRFQEGQWLHKENFLCAFTEPQLLAQFHTSYSIQLLSPSSDDTLSRGLPCDRFINAAETTTTTTTTTRRILEIRDRSTGRMLLDPLNLERAEDRNVLAAFLSQQSGKQVVCVTGSSSSKEHHVHQFGNTSSGFKQRGDTRTVHIVNEATVHALSEKIGKNLNPSRFRPNIVISGPPAWSEFDWVNENQSSSLLCSNSLLKLTVISKTVRCKGVSVDPLDPETVLDIPELLVKHFPEHGPYLGVYAVVDAPGSLSLGDELQLDLN